MIMLWRKGVILLHETACLLFLCRLCSKLSVVALELFNARPNPICVERLVVIVVISVE